MGSGTISGSLNDTCSGQRMAWGDINPIIVYAAMAEIANFPAPSENYACGFLPWA
jgi:hypothetical protein